MLTRRALGIFWAALLLALAAGAGMLAWLGPLPAPAEVAAPAVPEPPAVLAADPATPPPPAEPQPVRADVQPEAAPPDPPAVLPPPAAAADPRLSRAPTAVAAAGPAPLPASPATPTAPAAGQPLAPDPPPAAPAPPPLPGVAARALAADPIIAPPDPLLTERSRHGTIPRLGPDGRTAIRTYARPTERPAETERRPRIGLIIGNMGLFAQHSDEAIRRLPGAITLAFSPYALRPEPLLERARAKGMEVLTALPLEPTGFGQDADPGDRALLTGLSAEDNLDRLEWSLSRIQGQVGAVGALGRLRGERFAANAELLGTIQAALTNRGLLYIDPRPGAPTPARAFGRTVDLVLDDPSETRGEVERRLAELEALARQNGSALGLVGNPVPSVTAAILAWSAGLEDRGVTLAPVTTLLRRPGAAAR